MKKKKWEAFKGAFPTYQDTENPERIQIIQTIKEENSSKSKEELGREFSNLKFEKEKLEDELKAINLQLEARNSLLFEMFEASRISSLKLNTGETLYIKDEPYAQLVDKTRVNDWFIENEMDELRSVNWQTLNAVVKERLEKGETLPEGVEVYMKSQIVMRRG